MRFIFVPNKRLSEIRNLNQAEYCFIHPVNEDDGSIDCKATCGHELKIYKNRNFMPSKCPKCGRLQALPVSGSK